MKLCKKVGSPHAACDCQWCQKNGHLLHGSPASAGSVDLEIVKALRDQAAKDRESSANAKGYEAAARWDAWVGAYDHLLTVAAQDPRNTTVFPPKVGSDESSP